VKTVAILPIKLLSLILILSPGVALGVTELSDGELNQAAAETNAPQSIVMNSVLSDQAKICSDPIDSELDVGVDLGAGVELSDQPIESSTLTPESCSPGLNYGATDPLNDQPAEQFYGNLSGALQNNREFIEQNPYSGNVRNSPSFDPTTPLPTDRDFQRTRDLTLQFGESLQRLRLEP
jgi:hypothetical protein